MVCCIVLRRVFRIVFAALGFLLGQLRITTALPTQVDHTILRPYPLPKDLFTSRLSEP